LVDGEGKVRATLALAATEPALLLLDRAGRTRVQMAVLSDGRAMVGLLDDEEMARAGLEVAPGRGAGLAVSGKGGKGGATVQVSPDNGSELVLYGHDGEVIWSAP